MNLTAMTIDHIERVSAYLPTVEATNPGHPRSGTTPGSFARAPRLAPGRSGAMTYSSPDTPGMPGPSDKTAWDFMPGDWTLRPGFESNYEQPEAWQPPTGFVPVTQLEYARCGVVTREMLSVSERETHLTVEQIRDEVAAGRMVIPANRNHLQHRLNPMCIGRASRTKINANMGASPVSSGTAEEVEKLLWAERWGADTVMDLSTGGDLDACRQAIIHNSSVPIGTVPIYSMIIGRRIEDLDADTILRTLDHQARQGVDYFTIHAGVLQEHLRLVRDRLIGIVSRGGSLLAKWMIHHGQQNPMYTLWEDICDVMRAHDVTFSIGDGLRPGGLADATDLAQLAELSTLGELTERAWRKGVQVMIEGPGHVPLDQIEFNMKLQRHLCHGAPFYVLGRFGHGHVSRATTISPAASAPPMPHGTAPACCVTSRRRNILACPKRTT
jgi:phosphomethylpyrimidine synthase